MPWKAAQVKSVWDRQGLSCQSVCELGCAGEIVNQLAGFFPDREFVDYEISKQAFDMCQIKKGENLRFVYGDLLGEEVRFDLVLAIDVFEHVEDYFGFLRSLKSKGSYFMFHIPLDLSVQSVLRGRPLMANREEVGHLHYFSKETALAMLCDTGYEVMDYVYTSPSLHLPNRSWCETILKVPRQVLSKLNQDFAARVLGGVFAYGFG